MINKIKEYFSREETSNSLLSAVSNPSWLKRKLDGLVDESDDKAHFRIGSAIDTLLTDEDNFHKEFRILPSKRPTGLMLKFVEALPPNVDSLEINFDEYRLAYEESGYKISMDRVIDKFYADNVAVDYYIAINTDDERTILTSDEMEIVASCCNKIKANPFALEIFTKSIDKEVIFQLPIYWGWVWREDEESEEKLEQCKSLLDIVVIDHKNGTIQPIDLKTTGRSVYSFRGSFTQYGYYRQAAFYTEALKAWLEEEQYIANIVELREGKYDNYRILPFQFLVVDKNVKSEVPAMMYQCTQNDLDVGLNGGKLKGTTKEVKGLLHLMKALDWHRSTGVWDLPYEVYQNKGVLKLDAFDE